MSELQDSTKIEVCTSQSTFWYVCHSSATTPTFNYNCVIIVNYCEDWPQVRPIKMITCSHN